MSTGSHGCPPRSGKHEPVTAPKGEVVAARLWVMLLAGCLTVFAIGAEVGSMKRSFMI